MSAKGQPLKQATGRCLFGIVLLAASVVANGRERSSQLMDKKQKNYNSLRQNWILVELDRDASQFAFYPLSPTGQFAKITPLRAAHEANGAGPTGAEKRVRK
ncbi:hypothetical protein L596_004420 [Steinernema carpocapsae]|uniref:Uncharacterized protein n=1 Tax=Steinernema carpocapsae TaxID=34508 RepID=A0A4U8UVR4_STECR|nr:hypothetical protein L596_004420 [Steinernema carpocapsae]